MYEYILMRWREGAYTVEQIDRLVTLGWISAEQGEAIKATPQA